MEYKTVPIDSLRPDPNQPRKDIDEKSLKEMAISVGKEGLINAIEVDKELIIITGERRWRSSKIAGLKEVPVKIMDDLTPDDRFIRQVQENIHQNTMSPLDTALALDKIRGIITSPAAGLVRDEKHQGERYQKGVKELHELLGVPEQTISAVLDLLGETGEMREALKVPGFQRTKVTVIKEVPEKYREGLRHIVATQPTISRDTVRHIAGAIRRADRYGEEEKAEELLKLDFTGLIADQALVKINKMIPDEASRIKEPADAVRRIAEKSVEMMELLEEHPLSSLDPVHRALTVRDINSLGSFLGAYLKKLPEEQLRIE